MRRCPRTTRHSGLLAAVLAAGDAFAGGAPAPSFAAPPPSAAASSAPSFAAWSASPAPLDVAALTELERAAIARCGVGDARVQATARVIAEREAAGAALPDAGTIESIERVEGEPHPWPAAWSARATSLDGPSTLARVDAWVASLGAPAPDRWRRCGAAMARGAGGGHALVIVAVDALADLAPLPSRTRTGQWLTVEATVRAAAHGGRVFVLGPDGSPRSVPTAFDGRTLRARFVLDEPGAFTVQVVADLAEGPRPVLEARTFADVAPSEVLDAPAPGESAAGDAADLSDSLAAMALHARLQSGYPALARDPTLDAIATAHAWRMVRSRTLAHDAGDGSPWDRARAAGLELRDVGENVAHAATLIEAHRALWASPSHRANLLSRSFDRLGVAVVRGPDGSVWAVEDFGD